MRSIQPGRAQSAASAAALLAAVSGVSNDVMALMARIDHEEEELMKQFGVFQMGDKDSYSHDERDITAVRNALAGSETLGLMKVLYLRCKAGDHALAQSYNVVRKLMLKLGFDGRMVTELPTPPPNTTPATLQHLKQISLPDAVCPIQHFTVPQPTAPGAFANMKAQFKKQLDGIALAHNAGTKNTKTGLLQTDKILRGAVLRECLRTHGYSQNILRQVNDRMTFPDPELRNILDLYAKSWTNLASTW